MNMLLRHLEWDRVAGLLVVLAVHGAVLHGLWGVRVTPPPTEAVTLFVNFISPAIPKPEVVPPPAPPKPVKRERPRPVKPPHTHLAAQAPVTSPAEALEPLPAPVVSEAPPPTEAPPPELPAPEPPAPPKTAGPVTLASELAVTCIQRTLPPYPSKSRRLGETGKVVLRIEVDETGFVSAAQVVSSSGFERLDGAALAAVMSWRCTPAQRDGQAVRSVATQPFRFTLEGR